MIDEVLIKYDDILKLDVERSGIYLVDCDLNTAEDVLKLNELILQMKATEWCEPMMISNVMKFNSLYSLQYYLHNTGQNGGTPGMDINVEPAWDLISVDEDIIVAVIDDGVERSHEDLSGKVLEGLTIDYPNEKGDPINDYYYDPKCHGTACAGIIAAKDNDTGIKGVASGVQILPINVFPEDEADIIYFYTQKVGNAIRWADYTKGADIISCSLGFPDCQYIESAFEDAISDGREGKGTIVVCASGNSDPYSDVFFPANMTNTIAVGAINKNGGIWYYSCRGNSLDIVAPSSDLNYLGDIVTTDRTAPMGINSTGDYMGWFGGTSAACPQVAGVAALMLSANPNLTASQVRTKLRNTARDLGSTGFDTTYGYGLVNAYAAVCAALSGDMIEGPQYFSTSGTYYVNNLPSGVTVEWSLSNSYYNQNCLQQNYPSQNQCTITRSSTQDMIGAILTATIKYNGIAVQTLTKTTVSAFTGFKGTYISSMGSGQYVAPNPIFTEANTSVHIWSPKLIGATVTYTGDATPSYWLIGYNTIDVNMPSTGSAIVIHVICEAGDDYYIPVIRSTPPYYLSVNFDGEAMIVTLDDSALDNRDWTLEIYNVMNGEKVVTQNVSGNSVSINISGWKRGLYAARVTIGKEVLTEKVVVR